jgi:diguanylate cyclase (GGDEF)-like protein/PAS domain S-box-containing protein
MPWAKGVGQLNAVAVTRRLRDSEATPGCVAFGIATCVAAILPISWTLFGTSTAPFAAACELSLALVAVLAGCALMSRYIHDRHTDYRLLLGIGCFFWAASQTLFALTAPDELNSSLNHVIQLGQMVLPLLAVLAVVRHSAGLDPEVRFVFWSDALMMTTSLSFVVWELLVEPHMGRLSSYSSIDQFFITGPPIACLISISALVLLLLIDVSPARLITTVGLASLMASSAFTSAAVGSGSANHQRVAAVAATVGFVLISVGAGLRRGASLSYDRPRISRLVVVHFPGFVGYGVATVKYFILDIPIRTVTTSIITVIWAIFLSLSHYASWRLSSRLSDRLSQNLQRVAVTESQLRALLDDLDDAVVVLGPDGVIREANKRAAELTMRSLGELQGTNIAQLLPNARLMGIAGLSEPAIDLAAPEFELVRADGSVLLLQLDTRLPVRDPERMVVTIRDVTREREQERRLDVARQRFGVAFRSAPTGMALLRSADGVVIDSNQALAEMLGYPTDDLLGKPLEAISHPDDWPTYAAKLTAPTNTDMPDASRFESRYIRHDGSTVWANTSVAFAAEPDGAWLAIVHIEDVTAQRADAARLEWSATHDELTRLPNRFFFLQQLDEILVSANPGSVAVMFVDLDNFKVINDSLGHAVGDMILRTISERLRHSLRDSDLLCRFGGDEFIIALTEVHGASAAIELAERLRVQASRPIEMNGFELFVSISAGIAFASANCTTEDLLRDADAAMYRAKSRGRDCVEVHAAGIHDSTVMKLRTASEFRQGLERGEVVPYYQPIVHLDTGATVGFEVLARWRHPTRGLVMPDEFLPGAEETGRIHDLGAVMLRSSMAQLAMWRERFESFSDLRMSVNVSVRQLMHNGFCDLVAETLTMSGMPADALTLEITETTLMSDTKAAGHVVRQLRGLGVHLAVDDFGTGYSSLTYLKRFPVEFIKIDRSFVSGLGLDAEDSTIVGAVVQLGSSLGLSVVAEGVETPLQLTQLREMGCEFGQGYLFGRPRPADLIELELMTG